MERVRHSVQEHCDSIRRIIREEHEHWNGIHSAIDQYVVHVNEGMSLWTCNY
jgi:hypothetical protein